MAFSHRTIAAAASILQLWMLALSCFPAVVVSAEQSLFRDDFDPDNMGKSVAVWTKLDAGAATAAQGILRLDGTHVVASGQEWTDYELEFRARSPSEEVQIFASFRYQSDSARYVVGLRGENNNDLFLARYFSDGNLFRILKVQPLPATVLPLQTNFWYTMRVVVVSSRIHVYLQDDNGAVLASTSVADHGTPLKSGGIALGGGWNTVDFDYVQVRQVDSRYALFGNEDATISKYTFQSRSDPPVEGWTTIDGSLYSEDTLLGFDRDSFTLTTDQPTGDPLFDRFAGIHLGFTQFLKSVENGEYLVTLQMGSPTEKTQVKVQFQDDPTPFVEKVIDQADSALIRRSLTIADGQLKIQFCRDPGSQTYLNWLVIQRREDVDEQVWNEYLWSPSFADADSPSIQTRSESNRNEYQPIAIDALSKDRSVHSLNGDWLFLPSYEQEEQGISEPWQIDLDDTRWHVMDVPNFWTPHYAWTYMDTDQGRGSPNWVNKEKERCRGYTFDYLKTNVAFYRQHIVLPSDIEARTSFLTFEAIGKDAEVWVNGQAAGVHAGLFTTTKLDVSELLWPGDNVIVVKVGDFTDFDITDPSLPGVAEREPIEIKTSNQYPNGMLFERNLGIWQGVSLSVSDDVIISDSFFQPGLSDYNLQVNFINKNSFLQEFSVAAQIRSYEDNSLVYDNYHSTRQKNIVLLGGVESNVTLTNAEDSPDFLNWSPENPNLYKLDIFTYRYNQDPRVEIATISPAAMLLNFQPLTSETPFGWQAVGPDAYDSARGYGWNKEQEARERGVSPSSLMDTMVTLHKGANAVFTLDVENGDYIMTLQFGDPAYPTLAEAYVGQSIDMENVIVRDAVDVNTPLTVLKSVTVTNEKLHITFPAMPSPAIGTSINWMVLERRSDVLSAKWELGRNHFDILDLETYDIGFRTFTVQGDEFYLNGYPYKMRGANHCPNILRPNDAPLADWFTKKVHDKNINFSRAHSVPMNDVWFRAANKNGLGISQEGTWTWLMFGGSANNIPSPERLRLWKREWLSMVNKFKNHPSLLLWTVNNEMKMFLRNEYEPWKILSDTIKDMRAIDPTRPVIADSGNARKHTDGLPSGTDDPITAVAGSAQRRLNVEGLDDGDVDDVHKYYNWYDDKTFFVLRDGVTFATEKTPGRPYISQELSTGYPDADTGHPIKHYIYTHMNPQALVGKWSYEDEDPKYWLKRHAQITKETAEVFRTSYHETSAGVMMFSLLSWFKNNYDVNTITPWPTLDAVALAHEPIMTAVNLAGRNFYVGATETVKAFVVNDGADRETLSNVFVDWQIATPDGQVLSSGTKIWPGTLPYFETISGELTFTLPETLLEDKVEAELVLNLHGNGRYLSTNRYSILVCSREFARAESSLSVAYFGTRDYFENLMSGMGVTVTRLRSLEAVDLNLWQAIVVGDLGGVEPAGYQALVEYLETGGKVLFQDNDSFVQTLFPEELYGFVNKPREVITPVTTEKSVFDAIGPLDLSWFQGSENIESSMPGYVPYAASGAYNVNTNINSVTVLAETTEIHGYREGPNSYHPRKTLDDIHGYPLVQIKKGTGIAIVSSILFEATADPIANKLLTNILLYLGEVRQQQTTIVVATSLDDHGSLRRTSAAASSSTWTVGIASLAATMAGVLTILMA